MNVDTAPDVATLLKLRCLLKTRSLTMVVFDSIIYHLDAKDLQFKEGTIVDATIIAAPPSTKNKARERDPELY